MGLVAPLPGCCGLVEGEGGGLTWPGWGGYRADVHWVGLQHSAGWGGGRGAEGGGVVLGFPVALLRSPGSRARRLRGGGLKVAAQTPPMVGCLAMRVPPCNVLGRGCLASLGARRGLGGWLLVGQSLPSRPPMCRAGGRGGGGAVCVPPSLGGVVGGPRGAGGGGSCAWVHPSASLVWAPKRASWASLSPLRVRSPYCSGSCLRAAAQHLRFYGTQSGQNYEPLAAWTLEWMNVWPFCNRL